MHSKWTNIIIWEEYNTKTKTGKKCTHMHACMYVYVYMKSLYHVSREIKIFQQKKG